METIIFIAIIILGIIGSIFVLIILFAIFWSILSLGVAIYHFFKKEEKQSNKKYSLSQGKEVK